MPLEFATNWNKERPNYVTKHGSYKAFLETLNESTIRQAFARADNQFSDYWVKEFIAIANNPSSTQTVRIEQGSHQPENLSGGGFCLHFTGRDSDSYAFHFYVIQNSSGYPEIIEITYRDGGQTIQDFK